MTTATYDLRIAGHVITVRSAAEAAQVRAVARMVDERVREANAQGAGPLNSALMAALALADELIQTRRQLESVQTAVSAHADEMWSVLVEAEP